MLILACLFQNLAGTRTAHCSGLARVSAHPRPPKSRKPSATAIRFPDWIGGMCYANTLQVWFPAHWASLVIRQLQRKEDEYRIANPSWVDQTEVHDDLRQKWEAQANRRMQFKVGTFKSSEIRMLTCALKADLLLYAQGQFSPSPPGWAYSSQISTFGPVQNMQLDLTVRGTGFPHPPLHSPDCNVVGVVSFLFQNCCFTWKNISSEFATFHLVLADRRATARTTTRWAMQHPEKKKSALKADWIQLLVESYLAVFRTLKQGVIAGVFKIKGASPWAITRAKKIQVSLFQQSMDDWYTAVYALPTVWPDVSMMGMNNMRKVVGYDFHYMRKKYRVPGMWGTVRPQWPLLKRAGMVLGGGAWGETLYQQVQSTWGWYEGWSQNWWQLACLENLLDGLETVSFGFVSLVPHWSFLVKKESSRAYMTRSGKKSMLSRYSFLEVNKMYHLAEWKRGSK